MVKSSVLWSALFTLYDVFRLLISLCLCIIKYTISLDQPSTLVTLIVNLLVSCENNFAMECALYLIWCFRLLNSSMFAYNKAYYLPWPTSHSHKSESNSAGWLWKQLYYGVRPCTPHLVFLPISFCLRIIVLYLPWPHLPLFPMIYNTFPFSIKNFEIRRKHFKVLFNFVFWRQKLYF